MPAGACGCGVGGSSTSSRCAIACSTQLCGSSASDEESGPVSSPSALPRSITFAASGAAVDAGLDPAVVDGMSRALGLLAAGSSLTATSLLGGDERDSATISSGNALTVSSDKGSPGPTCWCSITAWSKKNMSAAALKKSNSTCDDVHGSASKASGKTTRQLVPMSSPLTKARPLSPVSSR